MPKPATGGAVYHVYPRDYSGAKLEPNFNSLMAAYNTGANGADFVNSFQPRVKPGDTILVHAGTYREELAPAIPRIWDGEVEDIRWDLRGWLREMVQTGEEVWTPRWFELSFGLPAGRWKMVTEVLQDRHPQAKSARVLSPAIW